jgi:hypothetical protein
MAEVLTPYNLDISSKEICIDSCLFLFRFPNLAVIDHIVVKKIHVTGLLEIFPSYSLFLSWPKP